MLSPTVLWAQTKKNLFVTVDLPDLKEYKIELDEEFLKFYAKIDSNEYEFRLDFLKPINKEESKYHVTRSLHFILVKKEEERWTSIVKDSSKTKSWLKCDWDKWIDTDEEDNVSNKFDMFGGMDGMGGFDFSQFGGMNGMGGMDDVNFDEDELGDYEEEELKADSEDERVGEK